jgi:hypothetical protein
MVEESRTSPQYPRALHYLTSNLFLLLLFLGLLQLKYVASYNAPRPLSRKSAIAQASTLLSGAAMSLVAFSPTSPVGAEDGGKLWISGKTGTPKDRDVSKLASCRAA